MLPSIPPLASMSGSPKMSKKIPPTPLAACCEVRLHLDANRNGKVDDKWAKNDYWQSGPGNRGAIIIYNCDRDDPSSKSPRDCDDAQINGKDDLADIAPLDIRVVSQQPLPQSATVTLRVKGKHEKYIRIFESREVGAKAIIGKDVGGEYEFTTKHFKENKIELGMEATQFPDKKFDGYIKLSLKVKYPGYKSREKAIVRVAPWLMSHHLQPTESVYVAKTDYNTQFIDDLDKVIKPSVLKKISKDEHYNDVWVQDIMEIGYTSAPSNVDLPCVLRTPTKRWKEVSDHPNDPDYFAKYPQRCLLGHNYGYFEMSETDDTDNTFNSFGNVECSPPVEGYPFGRIVYGQPKKKPERGGVQPALVKHLEAQKLQSPFSLDTGWLDVGHVDEFLSFIPCSSGTYGFKVVLASPQLALDIIDETHRKNPNIKLFSSPYNISGSSFDKVFLYMLYYSVKDIIDEEPLTENERKKEEDRQKKLEEKEEGRKELKTTTVMQEKLKKKKLLKELQPEIQKIIDKQKNTLIKKLGLQESDFLSFPVLFTSEDNTATNCTAFTPGSVNMLVVTKEEQGKISADLIIPKPFGPKLLNDKTPGCEFEKKIREVLRESAEGEVTPYFINDFTFYHLIEGEIHCGTNSKRTPPSVKWWDCNT